MTQITLWLDSDGEPCGLGTDDRGAAYHAMASLAEIEARMTDAGYQARQTAIHLGSGVTLSGSASAVLALVDHVGLVSPQWLRAAARGAK